MNDTLSGALICIFCIYMQIHTFPITLAPAADSVKGGGVGGTTEILLEI